MKTLRTDRGGELIYGPFAKSKAFKDNSQSVILHNKMAWQNAKTVQLWKWHEAC